MEKEHNCGNDKQLVAEREDLAERYHIINQSSHAGPLVEITRQEGYKKPHLYGLLGEQLEGRYQQEMGQDYWEG